MLKSYLITATLILTAINYSFGQVKIYKLYDVHSNADINYQKLELLNQTGSGYKLISKIFKPQKGKFTVYRLICTYKGLSSITEKQAIFHDIIILKTDQSNTIIDGYQYTLEWSEEPFTTDLYKIKSPKIKLVNALPIQQLRFTNVEDIGNKQQVFQILKDNGVIQLK